MKKLSPILPHAREVELRSMSFESVMHVIPWVNHLVEVCRTVSCIRQRSSLRISPIVHNLAPREPVCY